MSFQTVDASNERRADGGGGRKRAFPRGRRRGFHREIAGANAAKVRTLAPKAGSPACGFVSAAGAVTLA